MSCIMLFVGIYGIVHWATNGIDIINKAVEVSSCENYSDGERLMYLVPYIFYSMIIIISIAILYAVLKEGLYLRSGQA